MNARDTDSDKTGSDVERPLVTAVPDTISAKYMIRIIKSLSGHDYMCIEDFIETLKRAKRRCREADLLVVFTLAEKIMGNAERAIRYTLKYAVESEHTSPMERKIAISIEKNEYTKRYLRNLTSEIRLQVKAQKPSHFNEAQNYAVEAEMWLKETQSARITSTNIRSLIMTQPNLRSRQFVPKPANPTPLKLPQFNQNQRTPTVSGICRKC